jgi:hypothetical protein
LESRKNMPWEVNGQIRKHGRLEELDSEIVRSNVWRTRLRSATGDLAWNLNKDAVQTSWE